MLFCPQLPWVLPAQLKFPDLYMKFMSAFAFLNFALFPRLFRLECEMTFDHYGRVFMMTLGPILLTMLDLALCRFQLWYARDAAAKQKLKARWACACTARARELTSPLVADTSACSCSGHT